MHWQQSALIRHGLVFRNLCLKLYMHWHFTQVQPHSARVRGDSACARHYIRAAEQSNLFDLPRIKVLAPCAGEFYNWDMMGHGTMSPTA